MPKSKRNRPVTLSKTKKKGREHKENIVNSIRDAVEKYESVYVFTYENMRNLKFLEFRTQLKSSSRFFLGSNKVMQVALGRSVGDEIRPGLHKVSKFLRGDCGLCFTNLPKEEVQRLFNEHEDYDFARTGTMATEKVELKEGPLDFTHEMEPFLRKQGMPVRLNKGLTLSVVFFTIYSLHSTWFLCRAYDILLILFLILRAGVVELVSDFVVCQEGQPLSPESARILRLLDIKMATFRLHLVCRWSSEEFEVYQGLEDSDSEAS